MANSISEVPASVVFSETVLKLAFHGGCGVKDANVSKKIFGVRSDAFLIVGVEDFYALWATVLSKFTIDHVSVDILTLDVLREEEISNFMCPGAGVEVKEESAKSTSNVGFGF